MDWKGRAIDNVFIERFWRTFKYEKIYLNPPQDGLDLYAQLAEYMDYCNNRRRQSSLDNQITAEVYSLVEQMAWNRVYHIPTLLWKSEKGFSSVEIWKTHPASVYLKLYQICPNYWGMLTGNQYNLNGSGSSSIHKNLPVYRLKQPIKRLVVTFRSSSIHWKMNIPIGL